MRLKVRQRRLSGWDVIAALRSRSLTGGSERSAAERNIDHDQNNT